MFQGLQGANQLVGGTGKIAPCLCQRLLPARLLLSPGQPDGGLMDVLLRPLKALRGFIQLRLVRVDQFVRRLQRFLLGQTALPGQTKGFSLRCLLRAGKAADGLPQPRLEGLILADQRVGIAAQGLLHALEQLRGEDLPEDGHALLGTRQQQTQKVALGNHGHLGELLPRQPKDGLNGGVGLVPAGDNASIPHVQGDGGLLRGGAAAPTGRPLILGIPADDIHPVPGGEGQLHIGRDIRRGILASQHALAADAAAGPAVQGVGDRIKDGGLARAGIAADEVQPLVAQAGQLKPFQPRVGAEGGHGQHKRLHRSSSIRFSSRRST